MTTSTECNDDPYYIPPGEPDMAGPEPPTDPIVATHAFEDVATGLTREQIDAAAHPGPILVLAGAGTGKTSTLTAAVVDSAPLHSSGSATIGDVLQ
jgi:hypothetical protein